MLFLITFAFFALAMTAMALKLLLGRTGELRRGCGAECECPQSMSDNDAASIDHNRWNHLR
jgi:hypothetical protein